MAALKLEVFRSEADAAATATVVTDIGAMEEARLAAYEQGYSAGWDDFAAAQADDHARVRMELARNLQSLSFTYHEARMHVLRAVEPLLGEIVAALLPRVARVALAPVVAEALFPLARDLAETPVTLVLHPSARPAVEALLKDTGGLPVALCEEETLGEGQVHLRFGDGLIRVDLDRAMAEITDAVRDFFALSTQEHRHG